MLRFLFIFFLSSNFVYSTEVITAENKTHYLCATDNLEAAIYVIPPLLEESKDTSVLLDDDERWTDNWLLTNSTDVKLPLVLDKRWEDFGVIYTNRIHFDSAISLAFSTYGSTFINISTVIGKETVTKRETIITWFHFAQYFEGENNLFEITAETPVDAWWKLHTYKLRWADTVSLQPATITVSPSNTSFLVLYTYVCHHCTLQVVGCGYFYTFRGTLSDSSSTLEDWDNLEITVNSECQLTLVRNTTNGNDRGEWGIDIRQRPVARSNLAIYNVKKEDDTEKNRFCDLLVSRVSSRNGIFDCDVGFLGKDCNITCEALLGSENPYCEQHKICDSALITNLECYCAWGYQGESCDQSCSSGTWGLSCQNECRNSCKSCNPQNGKDCGNSAYFTHAAGFLVLLCIKIVIFLL